MPGDEPALLCAVVHDISERERVEYELAESESRFRQLFEQPVDAMVVHDERGIVADANQRASDSLGYTREELLSEEERADRERAGGTLWQRVTSS